MTANTSSWITSRIFEVYLSPLDRKMGIKNWKILLCIDSILFTRRAQHFSGT